MGLAYRLSYQSTYRDDMNTCLCLPGSVNHLPEKVNQRGQPGRVIAWPMASGELNSYVVGCVSFLVRNGCIVGRGVEMTILHDIVVAYLF